ncbi:MAG: NADP-dependent malic enzyme [bacterium]|nr:NADP-dependent malic enzyme [bacterium]
MSEKLSPVQLHKQWKGKIEVVSRVPVSSTEDLSVAYTPGVAEPCLEINKDYDKSFELTRRNNLVAVVTDGTAVLGLGDIGPAAAMPVMEGKCALFKTFADVDAFPICIDSKDVDTIVNTVALISKSFGGINLEDIAAPRCFEIERRLKEICDIPVFHDDQHGTAIVASAALINACKVTGKRLSEITVVVNGAGAAGMAISELLLSLGIKDLIVCDSKGIISSESSNEAKRQMALKTNKNGVFGNLSNALRGADVFIGVSAPNVVTGEMVQSMNKDAIVFAMANPIPEIMPGVAKENGAAVVGTGRSDFENQINNVLVFPGIFKGAMSVRAKDITENMKRAAAFALADFIPEDKLSAGYVLPAPFEPGVADCIAAAVAECAKKDGTARI